MEGFSGRSIGAIGAALALAVILVAAAGPLAALPALLGFSLLLVGCYPGADRLDRLIRGRAAHPVAYRLPPALRPATISLSWRGGELIARSLAERPPPARLRFA
jgi:hypothetical protein